MKKQKSVPNRKTIRTKNYKGGEFTSVSNKLLHDPNLSPKAKMLLIQMLSDSDTFTVSASLYAKRMNVSTSTIYNGFNELEEKGYLRRTPIEKAITGIKREGSSKKIYHYTISEFGNLNTTKNDTHDGVHAEKIKMNESVLLTTEEINQHLHDYIVSLGDYVDDVNVNSTIMEACQDLKTNSDLSNAISQIDKSLKTTKKKVLSMIENEILSKRKDSISQSKYNAFRDDIKNEVFKSNRVPEWDDISKKWLHYRNKHRVYNTDYETRARDAAEEAYYDGDSD